MNNEIKKNIPDEVLELLPWYAIGNLSTEDQAYFNEALSVYPLLEELVKQELEIVGTISEDEALLDMSAIASQDERLKSVLNIIDAAEVEKDTQSTESGFLFDKVKGFFSSLIPNSTSQYVPVAGIGILVVSVAVLTAFVAPIFTETSDFIPASAVTQDTHLDRVKATSVSTSEILVGFNGTASELKGNSTLKGKVLKIEAIADKKGFYKVVFKQAFNISEIKEMINDLTAQKDLIWFAGESF